MDDRTFETRFPIFHFHISQTELYFCPNVIFLKTHTDLTTSLTSSISISTVVANMCYSYYNTRQNVHRFRGFSWFRFEKLHS